MLASSGIDPNTLKPITAPTQAAQLPPPPQVPQDIPRNIQAAAGILPGVPDIATYSDIPGLSPQQQALLQQQQIQQQPPLQQQQIQQQPPLQQQQFLNSNGPSRFVSKKEKIISGPQETDQLKANLNAINSSPVNSGGGGVLASMFKLPDEPAAQAAYPSPQLPKGVFMPSAMRKSTLPNFGPNAPYVPVSPQQSYTSQANFIPQQQNYSPQQYQQPVQQSPNKDHEELVAVKQDMSDLKNQLSSLTQLLQQKFAK